MPWKIRVILDPDKEDVGMVSATYTQGEEAFTYSRRAKITGQERDAFVAEAIVARDAARAKVITQNGLVNQVETAFVTAGEEIE